MSNISNLSSRMMMPGLATGMDTDAMVKAMTAKYQVKIDKMGQDKQVMQWKQEFYREVIKDIKGLQDYFDPVSDKYIMSQSKFNPIKTTNSNESALGITAGSTAQEGNYKINVTQLAKPAVIEGTAINTTNGVNTKLTELDKNFEGKTINFNINGKPVSITVDANTTIQNVIDNINNTDLGGTVKASFDELSKKIVFSTTATGESAAVKVSASSTGGDMSKLGLDSLPIDEKKGQNVDFTITYSDGRTVNVTDQNSNKFTANGITYDLKAAGAGDITFTVQKSNSDEVVKNIKNFIGDYNKIVDKIESKLGEKKQFSYKPLTEEQKKDMKEDDIKKWEEKAKQGILRNDGYLQRLMSDLRGGIFEPVEGNSFRMGIYGTSATGLDTSTDAKEKGKLFIKDEEKLKKAITNNIDELTKFFVGKSDVTKTSDRYIGSENYRKDGLFTRMDKIIREYAGDPGIGKDGTSTLKGALNIFANKQYDFSITGMAGKNTIPDQIYTKALSVNNLQKKMSEAQERYYARFAQLETAMNKLNAQMNSMYSQFGMNS